MRRTYFRRAWAVVGLAVLSGLGFVLPAQAAPPEMPIDCGSEITANTTLTADIGPCHRGLTIAADGITLDLGGHSVFGITDRTRDGAGILFDGVTGATLTNGTVHSFDIGVHISGGGGNTVTGVTARDNVGSGRVEGGEGIMIQASSNNHVTNNTVSGNGPFAGISIVNDAADPSQVADANQISGNTIADNDNQSGNININQVSGIRIEGPAATNTVISGNLVTGSGLDGIGILADQQTGRRNTGTQILGNTVTGNGFHAEAHRKGDGIVLFGSTANPAVGGADGTTIENNQVTGNAANGIRVVSRNNVIMDNTATGNAAVTATAFDVFDAWPDCDANTWKHNSFDTRNQSCIK